MGGAEVQIRGAKATIQGQVNIRPLTCGTDSPDICDRASRQIGIAGRNWNLAFATDKVDVSGSTVNIVNAPTSPINDFNIAPGVGSKSSSTHTYTTTGNFKLSSIEASASGAMKIEVKVGIAGLETTRMIAFTTESNLTIQLRFHEEVQLTVGQRIQVIRTNREHQAMDVFSTILGFNT